MPGRGPGTIRYNSVDKKLWFNSGYNTASIYSLDPANPTAAAKAYAIPNHPASGISSSSVDIAIAPDGQVWFTESGEFGRLPYIEVLNPATSVVTEYTNPTSRAVVGVAAAPDGNIWFTGAGAPGAIGLVTLSAASEAKQLAIQTQPPASNTASKGFGLVVEVRNAAGQVDKDYTGTVTIALGNNPGAATLGGTKTATVNNGRAVFAGLTLDKAGTGYTIAATATNVTGAVATTNPFDVANPATHLAITSVLGSIVAGTPFTVTVAAQDDGGRVDPSFAGPLTLDLGTNPTGATLDGIRIVGAANGLATFSGLSISKVGTGYTLAVSGGGINPGASPAFDVVPAPAARFTVAPSVATATAGTPVGVTVTAVDAFGNVATNYRGTMQFTSTDPAATLPAPYAFQAADLGTHTFTTTLVTAGSRTLNVDQGAVHGSAVLTINPAATSQLKLAAPAGATAGVPFAATVSARDAYENITPAYAGTVHFSTSDGAPVLPPDATFGPGDGGSRTFNVTLRAVGSQTLGVGDGAFQDSKAVAVAQKGTTTTLTPIVASPTYGQALRFLATVQATVAGGDPPGGTVQFAADGVNFGGPAAVVNGVATSPAVADLGAGGHTITATYSGDAASTTSTAALATTIAKAPLTVRADDRARVYGQVNPGLSASSSGFVLGQGADALGGTLTLSTAANASSHAGAYAITAAGLTSDNYAITYAAGTLTVSPAPLTIRADDQAKPYGAALPTFTFRYSGFVNGDGPASLATAPTIRTAARASSPAGTYALTPEGASARDYAIRSEPGTLTVTPVPLTITPDDQVKAFGAPLPPLTARYAGFVNGDGPASLAVAPTLSTDAAADSPAGAYAIRASGAASPNYVITFGAGTLTVAAAVIPPPVVAQGAPTLIGKKAVSGIALQFSGPLSGPAAGNLANYRLAAAGRDKKFGTKDDKVVKLRSAAYDPTAGTLTLTAKGTLAAGTAYQLRVANLLDATGRAVDGNRDGQAGGDLVVAIAKRRATIASLAGPIGVFDSIGRRRGRH